MFTLTTANNASTPIRHGQKGITLVEVIVAMLLTMIASLGIMYSLVTSLRVAKITEIHYAASTLAGSKMEELAAIDVSLLTSANGATESAVAYPGLSLTFTRTSTVTVNADDSRTIAVQVESNSDALPTRVSFNTTLAKWE